MAIRCVESRLTTMLVCSVSLSSTRCRRWLRERQQQARVTHQQYVDAVLQNELLDVVVGGELQEQPQHQQQLRLVLLPSADLVGQGNQPAIHTTRVSCAAAGSSAVHTDLTAASRPTLLMMLVGVSGLVR